MKNKELPHADKAIGVPERHQESFVESLMKNHREDGHRKIEGLELEKSERDNVLIAFVSDSADEVLKSYGRKKEINISPDNIHLLKKGGTEEFTEGRLMEAANAATLGSILVDRGTSDQAFAVHLFHELLHVKSYKVLQVTKGEYPEERRIESYRDGFGVTTRDGEQKYFENMEEGVIELLTKRFYEEVVKNSELFEEPEEPVEFGRKEEVEKLHELIDSLYEDNKDFFSTREQIERLFIDAQINGRLLPVARLIEKTFGKGSFRSLGEEN